MDYPLLYCFFGKIKKAVDFLASNYPGEPAFKIKDVRVQKNYFYLELFPNPRFFSSFNEVATNETATKSIPSSFSFSLILSPRGLKRNPGFLFWNGKFDASRLSNLVSSYGASHIHSQRWKKYLMGAYLFGFGVLKKWDRVFYLDLVNPDPTLEHENFTLYFELTGRWANAVLVGGGIEDGKSRASRKVIVSMKYFEGKKRGIRIGSEYIPPIGEGFPLYLSGLSQEALTFLHELLESHCIGFPQNGRIFLLRNPVSGKEFLSPVDFSRLDFSDVHLFSSRESERCVVFEKTEEFTSVENLIQEFYGLTSFRESEASSGGAFPRDHEKPHVALKRDRSGSVHGSVSKNYLEISLNGTKIMLGKNWKGNLEVLRKAKGEWLWLHPREARGTHAVVCSENPDEEIVMAAADIVTYRSGYLSPIQVDLAKVKNLRPLKGARGTVLYRAERTVLGDPVRGKKLLDSTCEERSS